FSEEVARIESHLASTAAAVDDRPFDALTVANPCLEGTEHVASLTTEESLKQYEAEFRFADRDYYDRHLVFDHVVTTEQADQRQRFEAMALSLGSAPGLAPTSGG